MAFMDNTGVVISKENQLRYFKNDILPPEDMIAWVSKVNRGESKVNSNQGGITATEKAEKEKKLAIQLVKMLKDPRLGTPGEMQRVVYSKGGSTGNNISEKEKNELIARGARTAYVAMKINGVFVLEPVGHYGNATFIGNDAEYLNEKMEKLGRKGVVRSGYGYKVIHGNEENITGTYDYNHLIELLELVIRDPKKVVQLMKESKAGVKLSTIKKAMNVDTFGGATGGQMTMTLSEAISDKVNDYGITSGEVAGISELENAELIEENMREEDEIGGRD